VAKAIHTIETGGGSKGADAGVIIAKRNHSPRI